MRRFVWIDREGTVRVVSAKDRGEALREAVARSGRSVEDFYRRDTLYRLGARRSGRARRTGARR